MPRNGNVQLLPIQNEITPVTDPSPGWSGRFRRFPISESQHPESWEETQTCGTG